MSERLERKKRRARHWRQRAARVRYNELHQEWSRQCRYYARAAHRRPSQRVDHPTYPPDPAWWLRAIAQADPARQSYTRNQLSQPHSGVIHQFFSLAELFETLANP